MSLNDMKPDIVSGMLLQRLNDASIFVQVTNTDYEGEITQYGQSVRILEIGPVTIRDYTPGGTSAITLEHLKDASKVLQINRSKYYAFTLDDADSAQSRVKLLDDGIDQAAWGLRDELDAFIAGLRTDAGIAVGGTAVTGQDITSTNILGAFMEAARRLDETNTPLDTRWCVGPAWFTRKAGLAGIVQLTDNGSAFREGSVGRVEGFDLFTSNNVTAISGTDRFPVLFGYRGSISMAVQVLSSEVVRPSTRFVDLAKGLDLYGAKVVRPNNLGVLYADYTAEAT